MNLLPREEKFFALFLKQVENISEASRWLLEGARAGNSQLAKASEQIKALETKGDEITHDIFTRLNQTFITPLDPEDIQALSVSLDNVLDGIEDAAHRMVAYNLEPVTQTMLELCDIVNQCAASLRKAFEALDQKKDKVMEHCIEINRLENEADKLVRKAVADLFIHEKDPITIIKLKEVYDFLEATTDYCEDVADTLQTVVVKNS
jgi:predicted phosphate transport protein (TIGR00153 family)